MGNTTRRSIRLAGHRHAKERNVRATLVNEPASAGSGGNGGPCRPVLKERILEAIVVIEPASAGSGENGGPCRPVGNGGGLRRPDSKP